MSDKPRKTRHQTELVYPDGMTMSRMLAHFSEGQLEAYCEGHPIEADRLRKALHKLSTVKCQGKQP